MTSSGPEDIHNGSEAPILALLWEIIQRYQMRSGPFGIAARLAYYTWLDIKMPHHKIENFDTGEENGCVGGCNFIVNTVGPLYEGHIGTS